MNSNDKRNKFRFQKKFNGRCRACGVYGHKLVDCRRENKSSNNEKNNENDRRNKNRFKGTCNYCHKYGHKEIDCWTK